MRSLISIIALIILCESGNSQIKRDPRMVGMGGAYSTIATDYRCVGINPANLAFNQSFSMNLAGANLGFSNNMLSIDIYNQLSGANLEDITAEKYFEKSDIFSLTKKQGIRLNVDSHIPLPFMNASKGIFAVTSDLILITDVGIPEAYLDLLFNGISTEPENSDIGKDFVFNFREDLLGVNEFAFSFGIPYDQFGIGVSLKYLQGLFYLGIDHDSSYATLRVDSTEVVGNGRILLKQAIGGGGLGMDIGFATKRSLEGWKFGFSLINMFSSLQWNKPNITRNLIGEDIQGYLPYRQNEYFLFEYSIEGVSATSFTGQGSDIDSLFVTDSYTVVEDPEKGLIPSEDLSDANLEERELKDFSIDYPSFFRMGISKIFSDQAIAAIDVSTGFTDNFTSYGNWKFSFGTEITRFKNIPFRFGYSFGGKNASDLSYGLGYHLGPVNLDFGITFKRGIKIQNAHGIDISLGLIWAG